MSLCIPPSLGGEHGITKTDTINISFCKRIIDLHKKSAYKTGKVFNPDGTKSNIVSIRQVDVWRIHEQEIWLDEFLIEQVVRANQTFNYNLSGLLERPQLLRYNAPNNAYDWHSDLGVGDASNRKISCSILLNDDFSGGDLEFFLNGKQLCTMEKGDCILFSSFISHRVTRVTKGHRWALVAWFSGPQFR
mgnify:FL=1|tara:strand:- start:657 stop:1226 length:570 start_codon:yes stop_codon:yes gene_type:complete